MSRLYYLIATLPEFDPLDSKTPLDEKNIISSILENCPEESQEEIKLVFAVNDIRNIIMHFSLKSMSYSGNSIPYYPSLMNYDDIEEWELYKFLWPEFLIELLEDHFQEFASKSEAELTKVLWNSYFDALNSQRPFLRQIMHNYIIMHNLLGLIRSKHMELGLWEHWIGFESQLEDLKSGRLTMSGLAQEHENFNNLKSKSLDSEPEEAESWCDALLIKKGEELLGHMPFDMEHLLHYCFRLLIAAKWRTLQKEDGLRRFDFLKNELIKEIVIPSL